MLNSGRCNPTIADAHVEPLERRVHLAGNGLSAVYFDNADFTGKSSERVDSSVNFNWGTAAPISGFGADQFSARWTGLVVPTRSETYKFYAKGSDGFRLWVDGKLIIDKWINQSSAEWSGSIGLTANKSYDLRLEYYENDGSASMGLSWSSTSTAKAIVPQSQLYSYSARFAVIGDYGVNSTYESNVASQVKKWAPQYIVTTGDNNYNNGSASTIDANIGKYYHDYIGSYKGTYGAGAPTNKFYPALGNHDWATRTNGLPKPYLDYFTLPNNERYYDAVKGVVHLFVIDSDSHEPDGTSSTSKQATWLKGKLQASSSSWDLVFDHEAPYSSSSSHGSNKTLRWPYKSWGADAMLSGHNHVYERVMNPSDGMPYFVNGLGGSSERNGWSSPIAGDTVRYEGDWGAMLIQANSLAITYQFVTRGGVIIDTYTQTKSAAQKQSAMTAAIPTLATTTQPFIFSLKPIKPLKELLTQDESVVL